MRTQIEDGHVRLGDTERCSDADDDSEIVAMCVLPYHTTERLAFPELAGCRNRRREVIIPLVGVYMEQQAHVRPAAPRGNEERHAVDDVNHEVGVTKWRA